MNICSHRKNITNYTDYNNFNFAVGLLIFILGEGAIILLLLHVLLSGAYKYQKAPKYRKATKIPESTYKESGTFRPQTISP